MVKQKKQGHSGYCSNGDESGIAFSQSQQWAREEHIQPEPQPGDAQDAFGRKVFQAINHSYCLIAFAFFYSCLLAFVYIEFNFSVTQALGFFFLPIGISTIVSGLKNGVFFEQATGVGATTIALGMLLEPYISL